MEIFYKLIEVTVTLIEDAIIISSVVAISGRRYAIKKHILCVLAAVAAMSLAVSGLNRIEMFLLYYTHFRHADRFAYIPISVQRSAFCFGRQHVTVYFVIQSIDYILFYRNGVAAWHS